MRRICRVDKNQQKIVSELRKKEFSVLHLHQLGKGCPDLLVGKNGKNILIEVKNKKGKLTQDEFNFFSQWHGQIAIAFCVEDILSLF